MKNSLFIKVSSQAVIGSFFGIIAGFLLGLVIWGLAIVATYLTKDVTGSTPPGSVFPIMGMCLGAIIGSIYGGSTAIREEKK